MPYGISATTSSIMPMLPHIFNLLFQLFTLFKNLHPLLTRVTIRFDSNDIVEYVPYVFNDTLLNVNEPLVRRTRTRPDDVIYGAFHHVNGYGGEWTVANQAGSGLRVRFNAGDRGCAVTGLVLWRTPTPSLFTAANDALEAVEIFTSSIERLSSACIRLVVEEDGAFYISEASPDFAVAAGGSTGHRTDQYSIVDALQAEWFSSSVQCKMCLLSAMLL